MSIGGGGDDDDIDRLVDELEETNDLLKRLVEGLTRGRQGREGGEEDDEDDSQGDLWRLGDVKQSAISEEDYIEKRRRAATTESYTLPYIDFDMMPDDFDLVDFKVRMFNDGYDSIESVRSSLSNDDFGEFVWKMVVRATGGSQIGIEEWIIREIEPGPGMFGISPVERRINMPDGTVRVTQDIDFNEERLLVGFIEVGQDHFKDQSDPFGNLGVPRDPSIINFIRPGGTVGDLNKQLVIAAYKSSKVSLPDELKELYIED